jgi:hypothetical protein
MREHRLLQKRKKKTQRLKDLSKITKLVRTRARTGI